ncbi:MAG TPA: hypothetical protein DCE78_00755 [Bacteroidetes bacterium]|nr:hypothetical protein [Bacteroidota bacterium]
MIPFGVLSVVFLLASCTSAETQQRTVIISGEITINNQGDELRDFSGVNLSIVNTRSDTAQDTILNTNTDVDGRFSVVASLQDRGVYPLVVSRNNRVLHLANIVLAPGDTVNITGQIPDLNTSIRVNSVENTAMETYERLQRLYGRVATYAYGGRVDSDTIPGLMNQWSDYFWSLRTEYPGTYASELSSIDAIEVLEGWNDPVTMDRINQLENIPVYAPVKMIYGGHIKARMEGLDAGIKYLDDLRAQLSDNDEKISIDMRKIELLVDYNQYDKALQELESQTGRNKNDEPFQEWATSVKYELENLIPGREIPDFSIQINADETISKASMAGKYYLLEVVLLADANYQATYPDLLTMYDDVSAKNVVFYSMPLDNSQVTIDAFFEERAKSWTFSNAGSLDQSNMLDVLRIDQVPTRYLIGPDSKIISRYITHDLTGLKRDIEIIAAN